MPNRFGSTSMTLRASSSDENTSTVLKLGDQLGDVVRERHGLREPLLFVAHGRQLGIQRRDVRLALRDLRLDLLAHLAKHGREHAIAEHVGLELVHERGIDLGHVLVDGDRTDGVAAVPVARAAICLHAIRAAAGRAYAVRDDRAAAHAAVCETGKRVLCGSLRIEHGARFARRELRLHSEPRLIVDLRAMPIAQTASNPINRAAS